MTHQQHHQDEEYLEGAPASPEVDEGEAEMQGRRLLRIERQLIEQPDGTMRFESRAVYEGDEEAGQTAGAVDLVGLDLPKPAPLSGYLPVGEACRIAAEFMIQGADIGAAATRIAFAKGAEKAILAAFRAGAIPFSHPAREEPADPIACPEDYALNSCRVSTRDAAEFFIQRSRLREERRAPLLAMLDAGSAQALEQPEQPEQPPTVEAPQGATAAKPDNSENSGDERQATAAPPDNAPEAAQKPQPPHKEGVPKAEILAVDWPLPDGAPNMERIIKGRPKWASEACIDCGRRGGDSHLWNPALLAVALASSAPRKSWTVKPKALTRVISTRFPEYLEQWESYADSL